MPQLDEALVNSYAPNPEAISNGRKLVLKGAFVSLNKTEDDTLLFGECQGSGKEPYRCSCDFVNAGSPTHRCSCPSRQFPCKHCLGLMYAYVQGKPFQVAPTPEDVASKRGKAEVRAEKAKERESQPRKVDKAALAKKLKVQLAGLDLLELLTHELVTLGMGNTSAKTAGQIEEKAKQLANSYLPGAQAALYAYTTLFSGEDGRFDADQSSSRREAVYSEAFDQLTRLHAIIRQGGDYLNRRAADPELTHETSTNIAAWLGHAWQLSELREAGLVEANAELIQFAFHTHDDVARREFVDTGIWMNLGTGKMQFTQTFRPYKAVKYIKGDDSFFRVAQVPELCIYPGEVNPRVRWDEMVPRPVMAADLARVRQWAAGDFPMLLKEVKTHLKSPLAEKHPVYAMNFSRLGEVDGQIVIEDARGERLVLADSRFRSEPATCHLLRLVSPTLFANQTLIGRFHQNLDTRQLRVKPLAFVTEERVVRLTF